MLKVKYFHVVHHAMPGFCVKVMIVAEFVTVPAFRHLGVKIVLLAMLSGMLAGGMVFDCASRRLSCRKFQEVRSRE